MRKLTTRKTLVIILMASMLINAMEQVYGQCTPEIIDQGLNNLSTMNVSDIDGDGDLDLVACVFGSSDVKWYENTNSGWTGHVIDNNLGGVGMVPTDMDGDGRIDLLVAGFNKSEIVWYKNLEGSPPAWEKNLIDDFDGNPEWVDTVDIDYDGDLDVIATGFNSDRLVWYENSGDALTWTQHLIAEGIDGPIVCVAADMNGDDTLDVVINTMNDFKNAVWYKNENKGTNWTENIIKTGLANTGNIDVIDFDNDGDNDCLITATENDQLLLQLNAGGDPVTWNEIIVDDMLDGAFGGKFCDLDNDGNMDIIATANHSGELIWYKRTDASPNSLVKYLIDKEIDNAWDLEIADVNKDGMPDVFLNQWNAAASLYLYNNPSEEAIIYPAVGIRALKPGQLFSVYPNPSDGVISFEFEKERDINLEIFSIDGRRVFYSPRTMSGEKIDLTGLSAGMYLIRAEAGKIIQTAKLMIK